ncbi:hypothetical protein OTU49_010607 [Cherax quadricarinatus]|uniref:Uncharacterized protein n=1 Tax=Cherax quadricarinatus TaxID=27406 RepID=A0AAW0WDL6_CHEQU|nr:uncharacterized protein LOC128702885 [Cherax quadricarinatus]
MVQGKAWISIICAMFLLCCSWESTTAKELEQKQPWLTPVMDQTMEESAVVNTMNGRDISEENTADEMGGNGVTCDNDMDDKSGRYKRVFLSRGWGPGGYEAPSPPSQRFVRRPPAFQAPRTKIQENILTPAIGGNGGARYAALVSPKQLEQTQQKPQYRRFHSIFTSGTWSPLGKRSDGKNNNDAFKNSLENYKGNNERSWLGFVLDEGNLITNENKRSGVFASSGWGAGGSSPPKHPWIRHATNSLRSPNFPQVISMVGGESSSGGDRHKASFRSSTLHQEDKPLFHLFVSHGWGPMGR